MRINRGEFAAALALADMNVKQLSEKSGISRATITSIKSGKSCSQETAERLAAGLNVPLSSIIDK